MIDAALASRHRRSSLSETVGKEKTVSIAAALGLEDIDGPLMTAARATWPRWVADDPGLAVVHDLADLPRWLKSAAPADRDIPMAKLAALATDDVDAAVTLAWLLVPCARRIAGKLADRFHDLRHYFASLLIASLLIASGLDVKVVQARLRHASAKTTLDTYGHLWPDRDDTSRAAVAAVYQGREAACPSTSAKSSSTPSTPVPMATSGPTARTSSFPLRSDRSSLSTATTSESSLGF